MTLTNDEKHLGLPSPRKLQVLSWPSLPGASLSLAISQLAQQHTGLIAIFTPDTHRALQLEHEIAFFSKHLDLPVFPLPDWETLPYDQFSPHQDIISDRLRTLYQLPTLTRGIFIAPIATALQKLAPRHFIEQHSLVMAQGETQDPHTLRRRLELCGYRAVAQVMEHGEYAMRGSLLDIYPMGSREPYRIDFFDQEIDSIRSFDPETQRSSEPMSSIELLPAREYPLTDDAIQYFRQAWRSEFSASSDAGSLYQQISQGHAVPGIEYYLPLFFDTLATLFDFLPTDTLCIFPHHTDQIIQQFWLDVEQRYQSKQYDYLRPPLKPHRLFMNKEAFYTHLQAYPRIKALYSTEETPDTSTQRIAPLPDLSFDAKASEPAFKLQQFIHDHSYAILLCAESPGRQQSLLEWLALHQLQPKLCDDWRAFLEASQANPRYFGITIAELDQSFVCHDKKFAVITENALMGQRVLQRRRRKTRTTDTDAIIRNLTELKIGAPVVHLDHGVGRYLGLQTITHGAHPEEYLALEYADEAKLYVPVHALHLISRYSGADPETAPLHKLGNEQWQKAKKKAAEKVRDVAAELLDLYALRQAKSGVALTTAEQDYQTFTEGFPFEETPDQASAIHAVLHDLKTPRPMDRVICGDVGFGKTEVAMRATFVAVQSGYQVALLAPTTLLAEQHYHTFRDRFAAWPVKIEVLSRFHANKTQKPVLNALAEGKVDIVIGTHKLLQKDVAFKRLGLVIIDEEHRFGVRQKEQFRALRAEVDTLTLTATPIPRTLNMGLAQLRDLSIIATPPARRLAIKTFVAEYATPIIREAILREIRRGGQVYYVHNRIDSIERRARELREIIPEANVVIAHGQMRERELERVMQDFYHQRFNLLLCTTIIETGIDVPSANTIIIERADKFGLAQLHQLRGRVGRSHHQAYAYLLTPEKNQLTKDAEKRLDAITSLEDLGVGFTLATHDMEIRGAGELLGEEQSGTMESIGFSLYMELLERAVQALKQGKEPSLQNTLQQHTDIDLHLPALIPETYIDDVHLRLVMYKRIASAVDETMLDEVHIEMIDRFGLLPEATQRLFELSKLRLLTRPLGIRKISANHEGARIDFDAATCVQPQQILQLIQQQPDRYRLAGPTSLRLAAPMVSAKDRIATIEQLLLTLSKANS